MPKDTAPWIPVVTMLVFGCVAIMVLLVGYW
jgi:hypothetical protein